MTITFTMLRKGSSGMDKKQELERLVRGIPRSYDDFIENTLSDAEEYDAYDLLIDFIKSEPNINPGDVTKFRSEKLHGIKPLTDEEKQAYLDSLKNEEE